jgi:hypothetical protein
VARTAGTMIDGNRRAYSAMTRPAAAEMPSR